MFASVLGLGCNSLGWRADEAASHAIVHAALDLGITFFDTADVYGRRGGSERLLGAALGKRRQDVLIATKFGAAMQQETPHVRASRGYVVEAVERSLRRLGTDWIDLYQLHWHDPDTPIEETLGALDDLRRQGKIRAAGCCNLSAGQFLEARRLTRTYGLAQFVSVQAAYSALERDVEVALLPAIVEEGASLIPYFPLAGGLLTGKYRIASETSRGRLDEFEPHRFRFLSDLRLEEVEKLRATARQAGKSILAYSLQWLRDQKGVAVLIAGASRPEQVIANAGAMRE